MTTKSDICQNCGKQYKYTIYFDEYSGGYVDIHRICECENGLTISTFGYWESNGGTLKQIFDANYEGE